MSDSKLSTRNPWAWIPTLYVAEGLPYVVVMTVSVIMYKNLGVSNTDIALYTSWLYLPWVIKPLWSPVVDILNTRRMWIWVTQLLVGGGLAGVALAIPLPGFLQFTLAFFWLLAFSSATHDIAADGFYMLATTEKEQAFFVGIRSTFYRIAMISGQGLLVIVAGLVQTHTGLPRVELRAESKSAASIVEMVQPETISPAPREGELRVLSQPERIAIRPEPRRRQEVNSLIAAARKWNTEHGFYGEEQESAANESPEPGWWTTHLARPFGDWLHEHFGTERRTLGDAGGNIGMVELQLSKPPGKQVIVTFASKSGDKSIFIAEGSRFVFNEQNWNQPALAVIQLDPKLRTETAAVFEARSGNIPLSWSITFLVMTGMFLFFGAYHRFVLPHPLKDNTGKAGSIPHFIIEFLKTFGSYFRKNRIWALLLFLLLYRFAEAQLVKMVVPFLLDSHDVGGLGLTIGQVGFAYGTVGIIALTVGGLLGGLLASRQGLKFWLWPMIIFMHLPDAVFIYLAHAQPDNFALINLCVAAEQFGYGFGFTAYMLYMLYIARGEHQTAHYAICTGFMALGMMLPGMWRGWLQEHIGYQHFFVWVMLATIPGFIVVKMIPLDKEFGRKR